MQAADRQVPRAALSANGPKNGAHNSPAQTSTPAELPAKATRKARKPFVGAEPGGQAEAAPAPPPRGSEPTATVLLRRRENPALTAMNCRAHRPPMPASPRRCGAQPFHRINIGGRFPGKHPCSRRSSRRAPGSYKNNRGRPSRAATAAKVFFQALADGGQRRCSTRWRTWPLSPYPCRASAAGAPRSRGSEPAWGHQQNRWQRNSIVRIIPAADQPRPGRR